MTSIRQTMRPASPPSGLESVELTLGLIELLASSKVAKGVTEVALELGISKPRAHRHLRCLVDLGYASQDPRSDGYEVGIRVLALGELVRDRFDIVRLLYPVLAKLREDSGFAVTLASFVEGAVTVLDMMPGKGFFEFSIRPGARLGLQTSAHGLIALAFGPKHLLAAELAAAGEGSEKADRLHKLIAGVQEKCWARSLDGVEFGIGAVAGPVFDHRGEWRGSIAIVASARELTSQSAAAQEALVEQASRDASHLFGWRGGVS